MCVIKGLKRISPQKSDYHLPWFVTWQDMSSKFNCRRQRRSSSCALRECGVGRTIILLSFFLSSDFRASMVGQGERCCLLGASGFDNLVRVYDDRHLNPKQIESAHTSRTEIVFRLPLERQTRANWYG
jgi:hypothetical protein